MRKSNLLKGGAAILGLCLTTTNHAWAYGGTPHQQIVNLSWQAMRAGLAPRLTAEVWPGQTPPSGVPDFNDPGTCTRAADDPTNLCGEQLTATNGVFQEWQDYLADMRLLRPALNGMQSSVRNPNSQASCGSALGTSTTPLGEYPDPISPDHLAKADGNCSNNGEQRPGVFAKFSVPDDGMNNQGLILGWHANDRDHDGEETTIDWLPPVPFLDVGVVLNTLSQGSELLAAAVFVPFVCLYDWLAGRPECGRDAKAVADTFDGLDLIKGNLPGFEQEEASKEGDALWHFINVRGYDVSNWYDDVQGMLYDEAGPDAVPGAVDEAIMLAGDLVFMNLDASKSKGTSRYEITSDETSLPHPSQDRMDWAWQADPFPHTPFSPIDNLALYGHAQFIDGFIQGGRSIAGLGWPLHAIGDVTVPMHVAATTAWGHRPFEDAVNSQWRFLNRRCRAGTSNASEVCEDDTQFVAQLQQAHRILQQGYRWWKFRKNHPDVRDLVTELAKETYNLAQASPRIWCDVCSDGYVKNGGDTLKNAAVAFERFVMRVSEFDIAARQMEEGYDDPEGYYSRNQDHLDFMQLMVERASGASLGYLLSLPVPGTCQVAGENCGPVSAGSNCCEATRCINAVTPQARCCRDDGAGCFADAECCHSACGDDGQCCVAAGRAALGVACSADADCCTGLCANSVCVGGRSWPCTAAAQCKNSCDTSSAPTVCTGSANNQPCSADPDCSSGFCVGGTCGKPNGDSCNRDEECRDSGVCESHTCGKRAGSACTNANECADGICAQQQCGKGLNDQCSASSECASAHCEGGACCGFTGETCNASTDCCQNEHFFCFNSKCVTSVGSGPPH